MSPDTLRVAVGSAPVRGVRVVDARELAARELAQSAYQKGFAEGRAEAIRTEAGALDKAAQELVATASAAAVELAVEITRELVKVEVQAGRHDIERMVRDTLAASAAGRSQCVVHLNPADVAALEDVEFRSGTALQKDNGIVRGDVHVETSLGLMVREIDDSLTALRAALREQLS